MANKKKTATKKKSSSDTGKAKATPEPEVQGTAEAEAKANETPDEKKRSNKSGPRVWLVEPKQAASLKTSRGVLVKGRPKPLVEGSSDYEFYAKRSDVSLTIKPEGKKPADKG